MLINPNGYRLVNGAARRVLPFRKENSWNKGNASTSFPRLVNIWRGGREDLEFSLGLIYGQSSRNFSTKKKKKPVKYTTTFLSFFFFFPSLLQTSSLSQLSPRWKIYCFAACPIARHYLSFSILRPRLTSLLPPLYDRPVRIESDVLIDVLSPSLFRRSKKSAKKIRKSSRKQENRFNNNAFVKPKCRALDSTHRELSPINRVQTASGTRDEFGDKKEEEERERLEKSRRRGWSCKSSKGGFDLGGVVTTRK